MQVSFEHQLEIQLLVMKFKISFNFIVRFPEIIIYENKMRFIQIQKKTNLDTFSFSIQYVHDINSNSY